MNDTSAIDPLDHFEQFTFNIGSAMLRLWQAGSSVDVSENLERAAEHVRRERIRLGCIEADELAMALARIAELEAKQPKRELWTPWQARAQLGCSDQTVREWIERYKIPHLAETTNPNATVSKHYCADALRVADAARKYYIAKKTKTRQVDPNDANLALQLEKAEKALKDQQAVNDGLANQLTKERQVVAELAERIDAMVKAEAKAKPQPEPVDPEQVKTLRANIGELRDINTNLKAELADLQSKLNRTETREKFLQGQTENLRQQLTDAEKRAQAAQVSAHQGKQATEMAERLKAQNAALRKQITEARQQSGKPAEGKAEHAKPQKAWLDKIDEQQARIRDLERKLESAIRIGRQNGAHSTDTIGIDENGNPAIVSRSSTPVVRA